MASKAGSKTFGLDTLRGPKFVRLIGKTRRTWNRAIRVCSHFTIGSTILNCHRHSYGILPKYLYIKDEHIILKSGVPPNVSFLLKIKGKNVRIQVPLGFIAGRWYGEKKFRPILALHGWLDNLGTFDRLIPLMPRYVDVLSIDFPGHGRSSKMPPGILYNHTHFITVILLIMREYKWNNISLMGHSMGGILSFLFASFYPDRVDMVISIDIAKTRYDEPAFDSEFLRYSIEKSIIENERLVDLSEPPSYTYDEMEKLLSHTGRSIDLENCKFILDRNILKSSNYPGKFYFSRDARVKVLNEFKFSHKSNAEIAKTIPTIPYLVIKGSDSSYIDESSNEVISVLKKNNPLFEFHEIPGRHHLHLNNPEEVSAVLNRFIKKHRPLKLTNCSSETMSEQASCNEEQKEKPPLRSKL